MAFGLLRTGAGRSSMIFLIFAANWSAFSMRAFVALAITVEVAERIRQVGPNRAGSRGSYTVYRVAGA